MGPGMAWVDDITGSGTTLGAQHHWHRLDDVVAGLGTASRAWGRCLHGRWRNQLGSGKMAVHKGASTMVRNVGAEGPGRT
jgi:hypothetical protein